MKKLILLLAVTLVMFSCSKDNVNTETETTADLTQMTPSKTLDESSEGFYVGVFGHNEIKELHGKILINAANDGKYSAIIEMVNGNDIKFQGNSINKTNIHFTSDRGSFDFNTLDFSAPEASNVFIDNASESYIVAKKSTTRGGGGLIILGTYEETGNEAGFYGNFDMIGNGIPIGGIPVLAEAIDVMIVSHKGNRGPFLDFGSDINPPGSCVDGFPGMLVDWYGSGPFSIVDGIAAFGQTSTILGLPLTWDVTTDPTGYYEFPCTLIGPTGNGTWSWAGRSGKIFIDSAAPTVAGPSTQSNFDSFFNN